METDLGIDALAELLTCEGIARPQVVEILRTLVMDHEVILYRQEVFRDIFDSEKLQRELAGILPLIDEIAYFSAARKEPETPFLQALWRLGELEVYVECVSRLADLLTRKDVSLKSDGLRALARYLVKRRDEEEFKSLREELPHLRAGLKKRKSITIGVNLDERLRPTEAAILSVNEKSFDEMSLLSRLFRGSGESGGYRITTPLHVNPRPQDLSLPGTTKLPLAPLFQDLDLILKSHSRQIISAVEKYMRLSSRFLSDLRTEFSFYLGAVELAKKINARRLPICLPEIVPAEERRLSAEGYYNIHLAARLMRSEQPAQLDSEIVLNDLRFDDEGRIFILTGPNQGGKTTYTQGIGLLHVLAQAGLFIPAESGSVSPVDRIATHFPSQEKGQLDTGRLSEEASRLSTIFDEISPFSLVLLNESLSSTSPGEGLVIAEDIVRALRFLGARAVFATHLHELASHCESMNLKTRGDSRIISVTAGAENGSDEESVRRTYRIVPGPPGGLSYARDIADRYGISFPHLRKQLIEKKRERAGAGD